VDPLIGVALIPVALLAVAGLVRAARAPEVPPDPNDRIELDEAPRSFP